MGIDADPGASGRLQPVLDLANSTHQGTDIGHGNPLCTDCENFEKVIDVPGDVVSVTCTCSPGSHNNTSYCGAVGEKQAKWAYFTNDGNEQPMTMTVVYKKRIETCEENCGPQVKSISIDRWR